MTWEIDSDDSDTEAIFEDLEDILEKYDNVVLELTGEQSATVKITAAHKKMWKGDFKRKCPKEAFLAEGRVRACMQVLHDAGVPWSQMKKGECSVGTKKKVTFSATTASL